MFKPNYSGLNRVLPKFIHCSSYPSGFQNVSVFGDKAFQKASKLKWVTKVVPNPVTLVSWEEEIWTQTYRRKAM